VEDLEQAPMWMKETLDDRLVLEAKSVTAEERIRQVRHGRSQVQGVRY